MTAGNMRLGPAERDLAGRFDGLMVKGGRYSSSAGTYLPCPQLVDADLSAYVATVPINATHSFNLPAQH
jgi:hypothetical protein